MGYKKQHSISNNPESIDLNEIYRIKDLAIIGPDAELRDMLDGRRFFYYFDETPRPLPEIIRAGASRFTLKYNRRPELILLSAEYKLSSGAKMANLRVISLEELPQAHFWFGPKPNYYQLPLDFGL